MATLTISHHIFLTEEERHILASGTPICVVGCCIIVVTNSDGKTNEPARERFCKYDLVNNVKEKPISLTEEGFKLNLPQLTEKEKLKIESVRNLSDEVWMRINKKQREDIYDWISKDDGENLLNFSEGGSKSLNFKLQFKDELTTFHYVCIDDIDTLNSSSSYN